MDTSNQSWGGILRELANLNPPQSAYGTKAIQCALNLLNNPQYTYKVIHIAGSNGKGSTASFLEAGLVAANYKVAKFTSPYIRSITECIVVNQKAITETELASLYLKVQALLKNAKIQLSSFEMLTLLMFVYSNEQQIDYLILETGFGGRDDATNVVNSQFSIITNISLEHTQWLGHSLAEIAEHKAGIIKGGITVVASSIDPLINAVRLRTSNYINIVDKYQFKSKLCPSSFTTMLNFSGADGYKKTVELGLFGHFQALNFLAAYEVLQTLKISDRLIFGAARQVAWPGRLQLLKSYPRIILDASHNPDGCKNLYLSVSEQVAAQDSVIVASILCDKNQEEMLFWYHKLATSIIFCALPGSTRVTPPIQLARKARRYFKHIQIIQAPSLALARALALKKKVTIISGSTYLLQHFVA